MRRFPMSLSGGVRVLTGIATLLILAVPLLAWGFIPGIRLGGGGPLAPWGALLAPLVVLSTWALAPKAMEIEGGELRILRRAWRAAAVPLSDVERVLALPAGALRGAVRTFGNGGLFGYYGWYLGKGGAFRLYATRRDRLVEIVAHGKRIVVTPDEPARFVDAMLASAPRCRTRQPGEASGAASASRRS